MEIAAKTHVGLVRENNEDFYVYDADQGLFVVADGIGGHNAGEVASTLACNIVQDYIVRYYEDYNDKLPLLISKAFEKANKAVYMKSFEDSQFEGMGTTMTLGIIQGGVMYVGHVGDSRMYIIRERIMEQITKDHTLVNELLKNGTITKEESLKHPQRNIITKAIGSSEKLVVDIFETEVEKNDVLMLCSDGLTDYVTDEEISVIYNDSESIDELCDRLVTAAIESGGNDNITVMAVQI